MAKLLLLGLLLNAVVLVSNPGEQGDKEIYQALLQEKKRLELQKAALELEEGLVEQSLQDSAAYLVVDLGARQITAKLGGVPLKKAQILWRYGRPGHPAALGIFQVVEVMATEADSAQADSGRGTAQYQAAAAGDTAALDTLKDAMAMPLWRTLAPRYYDPARRYRLSLQSGPDLWLFSLPPAQSRSDSLKTKVHAWLQGLPGAVHRQSIHLAVSPADAHWVYSMAALGTQVLVIP